MRSSLPSILEGVVDELDGDRFAFVGLSVETTLPREDLARYVDAQGFEWTFAVMTPELLRALSETFGRAIATPPATPHFILRPDSSATALSTGIKTADGLVEALTQAAAGP